MVTWLKKRAIKLVFFLLILCLFPLSYWMLFHLKPVLDDATDVVTFHPKTKQLTQETILLPAYLYGYNEADIYARVDGYIKQWFFDIGAEVKKGDVLAIIEAPELDKEYFQTKERYFALKAQYKLAKITSDRWENLLKSKAVSQQETDEKVNLARSALSDMLAAKATWQRLHELRQFEYVRAPYDGRISKRHIDIGDLINRGHAVYGQMPLFHMYHREANQLFLYVDIPQNYMDKISLSDIGALSFEGRVNKKYSAKLLTTSHSFEPTTRIMKVKFVLTDENDELLPGAFVKIYLPLKEDTKSVELPLNALLFRADGMEVATVVDNQKVVMKKVIIGRDFGKNVEVLGGVEKDDTLIVNPYDSIQTGDKVHILRTITL
jgi:RND family efflux transporter MFP subunit